MQEVYYDRRLYEVEDGLYLMMICYGGNNEWVRRGIPVKRWRPLSLNGRVLFTLEEWRKIIPQYDKSHNPLKTRKAVFARGEFKRWLMQALKEPYVLEEVEEWHHDNGLIFHKGELNLLKIENSSRLKDICLNNQFDEAQRYPTISLVGRDFKPKSRKNIFVSSEV